MDIWKRLPVIGKRLAEAERERDSLRRRYEEKRLQLQKVYFLYEKRREATVNDFTDDEEMFLADLSLVLNSEDIKYGIDVTPGLDSRSSLM